MTPSDTTEQAPQVDEGSKETRRRPVVLVLVAIIALLVGGVAGWLLRGSDSDSTSAAPAGVEELLADYTGAWESNDETAFWAVVTDDFLFNEYVHSKVGDHLSLAVFDFDANQTASLVRRDGRVFPDWSVEHGEELIVVGDDPWFVSVQATWTSAVRVLDGTASYVIASDPDGVLRIRMYNWAGLQRLER